MEKAIEIKRRAQRCIQNGDLEGALAEYEKLVGTPDSDPYNLVLLADLLFKKGDQEAAARRYLSAASAYESAGLFKNGIAVCKKMLRLSLAPMQVFQRLAALHALDGLATEASLYYMQQAELLVRENKTGDAIKSLRLAFESSNENVKALERLGEVQLLVGDNTAAAQALMEAAGHYDRLGLLPDAERCRRRARQMDPSANEEGPGPPSVQVAAAAERGDGPAVFRLPDPSERSLEVGADPSTNGASDEATGESAISVASEPEAEEPRGVERFEGARDDAGDVRFERLDLDGPTDRAPALPEDAGAAAWVSSSDAHAGSTPDADDVGVPCAVGEAPAEPVAARGEGGEADPSQESPGSPGLRFGDPAAHESAAHESATSESPAPEPAALEGSAPATAVGLGEVERVLSRAQEHFRSGDREAATAALAEAANAYEALGRFENAASIYRSLGKSAHASTSILTCWLANCERRGDRVEGAQVACELGDRSLNDGNIEEARSWFVRAIELDRSNELSRRRLHRLNPAPGRTQVATLADPTHASEAPASAGPAGVTPPSAAPARPEHETGHPSPASAEPARSAAWRPPGTSPGLPEPGRVEVAVGRGEAVTFDLGSLIAEFQRGVEAQLSGDAQSHYDLAMAYREMGLLEQAVESFRVAAGSPALAARAAEMVGRCLLDQGRFEDAAQEFGAALEHVDLDPGTVAGLGFQLGLAYEVAGKVQEALTQFERVYSVQPNYPDVALKIRVLRKSLEKI